MATTGQRVASGQISIVDLNDGRTISKTTLPSRGFTQIYDTETKTFSEDYTQSPYQVIEARIYASGGAASNLAADTTICKNWVWHVNDVRVTSTTPGITIANHKLTIKKNTSQSEPKFNITWECDFNDSVLGSTVLVSDSCTINRTESGSSAVFVNLTTPDGTIFDSKHTTLQIMAKLMRGARQDTTDLTFTWKKLTVSDTGVLSWTAMPASQVTTSGGTSSLTVNRDDVDGGDTFKVEIKDTALNDGIFEGYVSLMDKLDEYVVELSAPSGGVIKNGQGSTVITPVLYKNNEVVTNTTGFTFRWAKYNKDGVQESWTDGNLTMTGNTLTVPASEVKVKQTIICIVEKN